MDVHLPKNGIFIGIDPYPDKYYIYNGWFEVYKRGLYWFIMVGL